MLIKLAHFVFILDSAQGNTTHQCSFCRVMPLGLKTVTLCTELIALDYPGTSVCGTFKCDHTVGHTVCVILTLFVTCPTPTPKENNCIVCISLYMYMYHVQFYYGTYVHCSYIEFKRCMHYHHYYPIGIICIIGECQVFDS